MENGAWSMEHGTLSMDLDQGNNKIYIIDETNILPTNKSILHVPCSIL
jgi:hypothetical protein